ncbi:hypothetical protein TRIATDRAFT_84314 [Trichoderma atroviride IMI 206040]|uniref:Uncharacterized protein n=1 Tax=Hypocrea atroviridis (strain ATCC 20476 / IMI 206040) TaxID=452589 RepID=G9P471_HYPAI|nr:uncharacterized protein TRIATDRAFT_84314 [Trichoderma atroviride IMI 206040]EHK41915.1 hypothetical protein TRIATDRAFT_84314 [Trichoderma atroviride IMI 206040]
MGIYSMDEQIMRRARYRVGYMHLYVAQRYSVAACWLFTAMSHRIMTTAQKPPGIETSLADTMARADGSRAGFNYGTVLASFMLLPALESCSLPSHFASHATTGHVSLAFSTATARLSYVRAAVALTTEVCSAGSGGRRRGLIHAHLPIIGPRTRSIYAWRSGKASSFAGPAWAASDMNTSRMDWEPQGALLNGMCLTGAGCRASDPRDRMKLSVTASLSSHAATRNTCWQQPASQLYGHEAVRRDL